MSMKKIVAIGSENLVHILQTNLGDDYIIENGNFQGTIHDSRRRILFFIKKMSKADIIYFLGISSFTNTLAFFARLMRKKVVYHWLGTDVWKCLTGVSTGHRKPKLANVHYAYAHNLQEELTSLGITSIIFTLAPEGLSLKPALMPDRHAVLLSLPDKSKEFYGYNTIREVILRNPSLTFYVVRSERPDYYPWSNVRFLGVLSRDEMERLYDDVSIVLRFPEHDGLSLLMMESTIKGKVMIYRFNHPFSYKVENVDDICNVINKVTSTPPAVNTEASDFGIIEYSKETTRARGLALLCKLGRE